MEILDFVINNALILIPVLYVLGVFLKATPRVPDWGIPWLLLAAGIAGALGLLGLNTEAVIQGVLVAGAAVLGNQLVKQTLEKN